MMPARTQNLQKGRFGRRLRRRREDRHQSQRGSTTQPLRPRQLLQDPLRYPRPGDGEAAGAVDEAEGVEESIEAGSKRTSLSSGCCVREGDIYVL